MEEESARIVKLQGNVEVQIDGNKITVLGFDGTTFVAVGDQRGAVTYFYHPLSGWYLHADLRNNDEEKGLEL